LLTLKDLADSLRDLLRHQDEERAMTMMVAGNSYYSVPDLRKRRWSSAAIRKFLPEIPDHVQKKPPWFPQSQKSSNEMKFWRTDRVHNAEKSSEFIEWMSGEAIRAEAYQRTNEARLRNIAQRQIPDPPQGHVSLEDQYKNIREERSSKSASSAARKNRMRP
jgi:hypothetical protein